MLNRLSTALAFTLVALLLAPTAAAQSERCPQFKEILGDWRFTTRVTHAHKTSAVGVNGFYEMTIRADAACKLTADISKTGFSKVKFTPQQVQVGRSTIYGFNVIGSGKLYGGKFTLNSLKNSAVDVRFHFDVDGGALSGFWYYEGQSWAEAGMTGLLIGKRGFGENLEFLSNHQAPRRHTCMVDHCPYDGARTNCSPAYEACLAGQNAPAASSPKWDSFSVTPQGFTKPITFKNGRAKYEGQLVTAQVVATGDYAPTLPGVEAVVEMGAEDGIGGSNPGSYLVFLANIDGKVTVLGSDDFTKYGSEAFAGAVRIVNGQVVVTGDAIGPDDASCCPCHTHRTVFEVQGTRNHPRVARVSRAYARVAGDCSP